MQLIIHSHYTDDVIVVSTADLIETFDEEKMFFAANRVESLEDQTRDMPWQWMKSVRTMIDDAPMPSMSVMDRYLLLSESGTVVRSGLCQSFGWRELTVDEQAEVLERAGEL